jgi:hypothetical protein
MKALLMLFFKGLHREHLALHFLPYEMWMQMPSWKQREALPITKPASFLISGFPASNTVRNKILYCVSHMISGILL